MTYCKPIDNNNNIDGYKNAHEISADLPNKIKLQNNNYEYIYITNCVKFTLLCNFVENASDELLNMRYANLVFCGYIFMKARNNEIIVKIEGKSNWMYFYRKDHKQQTLQTTMDFNKKFPPSCIEYCHDLYEKYEKYDNNNKHIIFIALNYIEIYCCHGKQLINNGILNKHFFENCLRNTIIADEYITDIKSKYSIIDEFVKHNYFKQVIKIFD